MEALKEFNLKGGNIAVGDDAGFIYSIYGFGLIQEMELLEEAGFHPLEVIKMATVGGAKLIGMEDRIGRVRQGFIADLLVVNGNPLQNLRLLNPYGTGVMTYDGKVVDNYMAVPQADPRVELVHGGGIEWTIKEGITYHVPTLMKEVRDMVAKARAERTRTEQ
jgi:adenine deaminase